MFEIKTIEQFNQEVALGRQFMYEQDEDNNIAEQGKYIMIDKSLLKGLTKIYLFRLIREHRIWYIA